MLVGKTEPDEDALVNPATFDQRMIFERHQLERDKINKVLEEWKSQQNEDRKLRKLFGTWLLVALLMQLAVITSIFALDALGVINVSATKLPIWLGALLIELIGLVAVIAKGLFANTVPAFMQMVSRVLNHDK